MPSRRCRNSPNNRRRFSAPGALAGPKARALAAQPTRALASPLARRPLRRHRLDPRHLPRRRRAPPLDLRSRDVPRRLDPLRRRPSSRRAFAGRPPSRCTRPRRSARAPPRHRSPAPFPPSPPPRLPHRDHDLRLRARTPASHARHRTPFASTPCSATLLAAYFAAIHARPDTAHRLPKELAVGIFFPAAVFIPTVARVPAVRLELLPIAALLAALCSLNCLFLYAWEHPGARLHAHFTTRWATRHLISITIAVAALSLTTLALYVSSAALTHGATALLACILTSSLLLLLLHKLRRRLAPTHLRALADLVLLTPLVLLALA